LHFLEKECTIYDFYIFTFDWENSFPATCVRRLRHTRPPLVGAVADESSAAIDRKAHGPPVDALLHQRRPNAPGAAAASALPAKNDSAQSVKEQKHLSIIISVEIFHFFLGK
jgi:hypothetical protein